MLSFQNFSKKSNKKKIGKQPKLQLADWIKLANDDESMCELTADR
jgi:hypothetical protein